MTSRERLAQIPKAELHLHLEGAIPHAALFELIGRHGGDPAIANVADIERQFRFRDFPHFIEMWIWKNGFLRTYEDFTFIAAAMARELAAENVRYAEVHFSPARFRDQGLALAPLARAIRRGLGRVPAVEIALIADLVRDLGPDQALITVDAVAEVAGEAGIVAVGMGGSEHAHPPEPFAPAFARARAHGLHTTAHAGEAAGPDSIRGALDALAVERIGHGLRAEEDPGLVDLLAERRVPLELCPLSNVATGVTADIAAHPIRRYFDRGLMVTVSTDDPGMFGNPMTTELAALSDTFGFTLAEHRQLQLNAVAAAFLPPERKAALAASIADDPAWTA
ncbi:MAG: adenosine deaminase [Alphaproteobacteria bacterium]|nr:adenosine deaminase [Alphaproteobacteria bacterium]